MSGEKLVGAIEVVQTKGEDGKDVMKVWFRMGPDVAVTCGFLTLIANAGKALGEQIDLIEKSQ